MSARMYARTAPKLLDRFRSNSVDMCQILSRPNDVGLILFNLEVALLN
jgi:hypothetical protein